jgi:2-C-methyl-D-erythritol 4-phosphate cytidylyltransferase
MKFHGLIPAAGTGFRFGAGVPKQYLELRGKPVLEHAIERLRAYFPLTRTYVILAPHDRWFEQSLTARDDVTVLRCGGETRAASVRNALAHLDAAVAPDDWIVVHDAVRPCLDREASLRLQRELADDPVGGFLAIPVSDTLKRLGDDGRVQRTEPRDALWRAQTPQMFRYRVLREAFVSPARDATDEAHAVESLGHAPRCVQGSASNVKVTFPDDLPLAAAILSARFADE